MGPSGPVALNMLAVDKAMDDYHIDESERILFSQKVRNIAAIVINEQYEAQEAKRKANKKGR